MQQPRDYATPTQQIYRLALNLDKVERAHQRAKLIARYAVPFALVLGYLVGWGVSSGACGL